MELEYTIIVWRESDRLPELVYGTGRDALDALQRLRDDGTLDASRRDVTLVAVVSGFLEAAATVVDLAQRPGAGSGAMRTEHFTVFGFWKSSGETFSRIEKAASGIQAMRLAAAHSASPNRGGLELQVALAFPGEHKPLVTRETVPAFW